MFNFLEKLISVGNTILWQYVLIAMLLIFGVYFTIKSDFVQFKFFKEMFRLLGDGGSSCANKKDEHHISSFQAFCMSTASRVGTGNLAGVAIAISIGGPGAVFWMWVIALIGAASSFVESTLAQIYKVPNENGGFRGGPAYYMEKALNKRWMGVVFSILITISFGLIFNSVQSNTISLAFNGAFGVNESIVGIVLAIFTALIIFGGVKRIAKVTEFIVPIMAVAYILVSLFVIIKNASAIPSMISLIFTSAFGFKQAIGGSIGAALMQGIKRGLFSNEAGMGSAPNAAATASVTHPVKQGLIQTLGVFTDTLLICSATSFIILLSGVYTQTDLSGIQLTQVALSSEVGAWGNSFVAICILLFAFSSIIGNYYYGQTNIEFISSSKVLIFVYRIAVISMVLLGSLSNMELVWSLADLFMGLMAIINLIAISQLSKIAFSALSDYSKQKKAGVDPVFYASNIGVKNTDCWEDKKPSNMKNAQ